MKVSIIIPTLNESEHIENTLKNWLNQTYKDIEIIIVDGGSTDGTLDIIQKLSKKHPNIKLLIRKKAYPPEARNIGAKEASGEIIALMDADTGGVNDRFIEYTIKHFKDADVIGVDPKFIPTKDTWVESAITYGWDPDKTFTFYIHPRLMRRTVFLDLGGFPLVGGEDRLLGKKVNELLWTTSKKIVMEQRAICYFHVTHTVREFWKGQRWKGRAYPYMLKATGDEPSMYAAIYLNAVVSYSIFFAILIPISLLFVIAFVPLIACFLWYLVQGIKHSAVKIFMAKFLLYFIGGFARGIGFVESIVRKKRAQICG